MDLGREEKKKDTWFSDKSDILVDCSWGWRDNHFSIPFSMLSTYFPIGNIIKYVRWRKLEISYNQSKVIRVLTIYAQRHLESGGVFIHHFTRSQHQLVWSKRIMISCGLIKNNDVEWVKWRCDVLISYFHKHSNNNPLIDLITYLNVYWYMIEVCFLWSGVFKCLYRHSHTWSCICIKFWWHLFPMVSKSLTLNSIFHKCSFNMGCTIGARGRRYMRSCSMR